LWLQRALYAADAPSPRKKILVSIFQLGAADGLNIVVPHAEKPYYDLRPTISVPPPTKAADKREDAAIDLDGFFGLHPSLAPLKPIWENGHLAIVQAAGSPDPSRSHFDAQDFMESGTPGFKGTTDGWMNRALPQETGHISPVRAVSIGAVLPRVMRGPNSAIAIESIGNFQVRNAEAARALETLYADSSDPALQATAREAFEAAALLQSLQKQKYEPANGATYKGHFGDSLRQIAQLIKADAGVEMAFADVGGWDHHVNETGVRASQGQLAARLAEFGQSLAAFWLDLGDRMQDVAVVTMSEFGRTAKENGDRGTDHGHANCMFVMGGGVRGGKVYGDWPGLDPEQLYEARDLMVTTDFRDVLGELVKGQCGNRDIGKIFPGYTIKPRKLLADA